MKYGCAPKSFNVHKNAGRLDIHLIQHPVRKTNALVRFRRAIFHSSDTFRYGGNELISLEWFTIFTDAIQLFFGEHGI